MPKPSEFRIQSSEIRVKHRSGFTIIELLAVISLIAIISGIGFASLVSYSRSQVLSQAAEDVKQTITEAKFDSLSNVKPVICNSSDFLDSYTLYICSNGANSAVCSTESISNNKGYFISAKCGNKTQTVQKKSVASNLSINSSCQTLKFDALSATFSGTTTSGFPCAIVINGFGTNKTINVGPLGNTN